jgi:hypothetical protein
MTSKNIVQITKGLFILVQVLLQFRVFLVLVISPLRLSQQVHLLGKCGQALQLVDSFFQNY